MFQFVPQIHGQNTGAFPHSGKKLFQKDILFFAEYLGFQLFDDPTHPTAQFFIGGAPEALPLFKALFYDPLQNAVKYRTDLVDLYGSALFLLQTENIPAGIGKGAVHKVFQLCLAGYQFGNGIDLFYRLKRKGLLFID